MPWLNILDKIYVRISDNSSKFGEIERSGILFVANHAFDCIGAKAYGFRSVFIDRRQRPFGESPFQPDLIVKNLDELSDILK